jgi:ribosomal protein L11 methyltransferase
MTRAGWTQIWVKVERDAADAVANFLMEMGSPGLEVEEVDDRTILKGYFRGEAEGSCRQLARYLKDLKSMGLSGDHEGPRQAFLAEEDWLSSWRSHFGVLRIGRRLLIKPSWETVTAAAGQLVIVIDPQMAFGTGEHPTTRFCLQTLEKLVHEGDLVLDLGTGSGILAIAAVKLGAKRVLGLDIDPQAIVTARENARINGVSTKVDFSCSSLDPDVRSKRFDLVVVNINSEVVLPLLQELKRVLNSKGHIILSGLLVDEEGLLRRSLSASGLRLLQLERQGEWLSVVLESHGI